MATTIRPEDIQRGDAFWYTFPPYEDSRYQHLIRGRHMVLVLQNNGLNRSVLHDRVIVCPISTARAKHVTDDGTAKRPFQALLEPNDCIGDEPLDHLSVVTCGRNVYIVQGRLYREAISAKAGGLTQSRFGYDRAARPS